MVATKMPLEAKKGPKNAKYWSKNPDEKIYLDFGDQNFKNDQKSFSPGSRQPKRNFSEKSAKKNPKKIPIFPMLKILKNPYYELIPLLFCSLMTCALRRNDPNVENHRNNCTEGREARGVYHRTQPPTVSCLHGQRQRLEPLIIDS